MPEFNDSVENEASGTKASNEPEMSSRDELTDVYTDENGFVIIKNDELPKDNSVRFHGHTLAFLSALRLTSKDNSKLSEYIDFLKTFLNEVINPADLEDIQLDEKFPQIKNFAKVCLLLLPQIRDYVSNLLSLRIEKTERLQKSQRENSVFSEEIEKLKERKKKLAQINFEENIHFKTLNKKLSKSNNEDSGSNSDSFSSEDESFHTFGSDTKSDSTDDFFSPDSSPLSQSPKEIEYLNHVEQLAIGLMKHKVAKNLYTLQKGLEGITREFYSELKKIQVQNTELENRGMRMLDIFDKQLQAENLNLFIRPLTKMQQSTFVELLNETSTKSQNEINTLDEQIEELGKTTKDIRAKAEEFDRCHQSEEITEKFIKLQASKKKFNNELDREQLLQKAKRIKACQQMNDKDKIEFLKSKNLHSEPKNVDQLSEQEKADIFDGHIQAQKGKLSQELSKKRKMLSFSKRDEQEAEKILLALGFEKSTISEMNLLEQYILTKHENPKQLLEYQLQDLLVDPRFDEFFLPIRLSPEAKNPDLRIAFTGDIPREKPRCYVTAHCLFAGALVGQTAQKSNFQLIDHNLQFALLEKSDVVNHIDHIEQWSPYEMAMFAQLEKQFRFTKINNGEQEFKIRYHLPEDSYKLSGLRLFMNNTLTFDSFKKYLTAVEKRSAAHRKVIKALAQQAGISDNLIIESPFDNIDMKKIIMDYANPFQVEEVNESTLTDIILQQLLDDNRNPIHKVAWQRVLPPNIKDARDKIKKSNDDALTEQEKRLKKISGLLDLMHLANSMMLAIAKQGNIDSFGQSKNYDVMAFHSWDEKPIAANFGNATNQFSLEREFGKPGLVDIFPNCLYYGNNEDNNLFRVTKDTTDKVREKLKHQIIEHYECSETLQEIIKTDDINKIPEVETALKQDSKQRCLKSQSSFTYGQPSSSKTSNNVGHLVSPKKTKSSLKSNSSVSATVEALDLSFGSALRTQSIFQHSKQPVPKNSPSTTSKVAKRLNFD